MTSKYLVSNVQMYLSLFQSNPETLYLNMNHVQADVLVSNKLNIPKCKYIMNRKNKECELSIWVAFGGFNSSRFNTIFDSLLTVFFGFLTNTNWSLQVACYFFNLNRRGGHFCEKERPTADKTRNYILHM